MTDKVARISDYGAGAKSWTPEDALKDMLERIQEGKIKPKKLVVHYLEEKDCECGGWDAGWCVAGVDVFEHVAVLELARDSVMRWWRGHDD